MLTKEEGKELVRTARKNIEYYLDTGKKIELGDIKEKYKEKRGVFVTLKKKGELRGCIGYPRPIMPLMNALLDTSVSAATRDPRFPAVSRGEMKKITVEVTVLTPPKLIQCNPQEYPERIEIGKDGLIVEKNGRSGLLLPQVPTEWDWDEEEFLSHTCRKAGLPIDTWLEKDTIVYRFQGQIFTEE
ncbi:MAG: TIGR00296 family protein [Euryarchaeota archaeon]|nr:TIGR00296 family protein [Euryarchaeota archaeon]